MIAALGENQIAVLDRLATRPATLDDLLRLPICGEWSNREKRVTQVMESLIKRGLAWRPPVRLDGRYVFAITPAGRVALYR